MENLIIKEHYNDKVLEWNEITGRYQLTLPYVKTLFDAMPYKNDSIAKKQIKQTSLRVYSYIVAHSNTVNRPVVDFLLNKTENGRKFLIEVLTSQMEADMSYAYNDLVVRPLINAANGQEGNRDVYKLNAVSVETEMIIRDSNHYFGVNLTYMGEFPWYLFDLARKNGD